MLIQRWNAVLLHDCFVDEVAGHSFSEMHIIALNMA